MNKVVIITDSTCDLSKELIKQHDIKVLPLHVVFNDVSYNDTEEEMPTSKMFEMVKELNMIPKTSGISSFEFEEFFKLYLDQGYDIFYIGLSSTLSTTYSQAAIAASELDKDRIFISDSRNLSTGIGLLLLKACRYRDLGFSASEIKRRIDAKISHVKVQFVLHTLEHLYKGGRCGQLINILGKTVRLRPLIVVRDGKMKIGRLNIGLMKKAVNKMANTFIKDFDSSDKDNVFITYSDGAEDLKDMVLDRLNELDIKSKVNNLLVTKAGNVISAHCGPSCIGILYIMKDDLQDDDLEEIN